MIDERTLLFMMVVIPGLLGLVSLGVRRGLPNDIAGLGHWACALLLISLASTLPAFTSSGFDGLRPILSNLGYTPAASLLGYALIAFLDRPRRPGRWILATGLVYLAGAGLTLAAWPDLSRIALISLHLIVVASLAACALAWAPRRHWGLGHGLLAMALLLLILAPLLRLLAAVWGGGPVTFMSGSNPAVAWYLILLNIGLLFGTLGLILESSAEVQRRLQHLATHDSLTQLLTRRGFSAQAAPLIEQARRQGQPLSLAIVDIDHFKQVNDRHGHHVGDRVLQTLSRALQDGLRGHDLLGRFGGEEFVVLLPATDAATARDIAERLRRQLQSLSHADSHQPLTVTASIGLATTHLSEPGDPLEALYRHADGALYRAKAAGRNQVQVHSPAA